MWRARAGDDGAQLDGVYVAETISVCLELQNRRLEGNNQDSKLPTHLI